MNLQTVKPRARWSPSPYGNRPDGWRVTFPGFFVHFAAGTLGGAIESAYRIRLEGLTQRGSA